MTQKKPTLYSLKGIDKVAIKVETLTCANCKRTFERKSGRVFICLFCGSDKSL